MKKDWVIRAFKTFWQAATAAVMISLPEIMTLIPEGWEVLKPLLASVGCGALAAGISAVYNGLIAPKLGGIDNEQQD